MQSVKTIGLDIAKSIFQVRGVDADGQVVIRRQLKRRSVLSFFSEGATVQEPRKVPPSGESPEWRSCFYALVKMLFVIFAEDHR